MDTESPEHGMNMFARVQWTNAIPLVPFVGATGIYTAFCKILVSISNFWGIPGTAELINENASRNLFFAAIYGVEKWYSRLGIHFLHSIDITSAITASLTAELFLKMIATVTLVHERLFWIHLDNNGNSITGDDVRMAVQQFRSDGGKHKMANTIKGNVFLGGYSKKKCMELLKEAIEIGKSPKYAELLAKHTMSY